MDTTDIVQHEARVVIVDQENHIKEKLVYRADYKKGTFVTAPL
jgi:aspartate 1-decarboxylase